MNASIIGDTVREILHSEPPPKLVKLADSLSLQSSTSIPLKPNLEPARVHICCVLAAEKLGEQLDLPTPDIGRPPVPPAVYAKLLDQFRQTLIGDSAAPLSSTSAWPNTGSGKRRQRRNARTRVALPDTHAQHIITNASQQGVGSKAHAEEHGSESVNDIGSPLNDLRNVDSDDSFSDNDLEDRDDDDDARLRTPRTPRKRAPTAPRGGSPTPRKTSPRKRTKSSSPTPQLVEQLGGHMGLAPETTDAVRHAFQQYCDLVKDPWGLIYGLFAVISERAEPRMGMENLNRLDRALREVGPPRLAVDPNEWVPWVERIVTGQTWIMKISKRPEPTPKLVGAPGGWGLGVEYTLVDS